MAEDANGLSGVDATTLAPMVRELLDEPTAVVTEGWTCRPLGGGAGEGLGLYRVAGSARVRCATHPWALVVKVCAAADVTDPGAWDYPAREAMAYGSGLLAALPGGSPPRAAWPSRRSQTGQPDSGSRRSPTRTPVRGPSTATPWPPATSVASTGLTSPGHPYRSRHG
jgi:hypothetical protein